MGAIELWGVRAVKHETIRVNVLVLVKPDLVSVVRIEIMYEPILATLVVDT
jgi:hypothetical protein